MPLTLGLSIGLGGAALLGIGALIGYFVIKSKNAAAVGQSAGSSNMIG